MSSAIRRGLEGLAALLLAGVTVAWLSGTCGRKIGPGEVAPPASPVPAGGSVVTVRTSVEPVLEEVSGTVESAHHTTVSSEILARIEEVRVRAGSEVAVGDVVIVLDARDLEARLREAEQARTAARSQLELATSERNRIQELFRQGIAPRRDADRVVSAFQVATAEAARAEQRVRDAEVALSHAEIRSPVAGRVVDRLAEPGDTAAPGVPLLRIYDPSVLRLEAPVRESLARHLAVGQHVPVSIEATGQDLDGTVEEIVPQAEPGARTFLVKVRFPPHPGIFAGMFGRIAVPAGERARIAVPGAAVERIGQLEFVTVIGADGTPERRLVTTGTHDDDGAVEVLSGLAPGEQVRVPAASSESG
jgi:membrane fusion protein (multidrug efflux system)